MRTCRLGCDSLGGIPHTAALTPYATIAAITGANARDTAITLGATALAIGTGTTGGGPLGCFAA